MNEPTQVEACEQEVRDAIAFYEANGWDWLQVVCFLTFRQLFGRDVRIVHRSK